MGKPMREAPGYTDKSRTLTRVFVGLP